MPHEGLSDHDIQLELLLGAFQENILDNLEPELPVDNRVDIIRDLEITWTTFAVKLRNQNVLAVIVRSLGMLYTPSS